MLLPLRGLLLAGVFVVALGLLAQGALAYGFFTGAALLFELGRLQFFLPLSLLALLFALGLLLAAICLFGGMALGVGAGIGVRGLGAFLRLLAGPRIALGLFAQGALAYGFLALAALLFQLRGLQLFLPLPLLALLLALRALAGFEGAAVRCGRGPCNWCRGGRCGRGDGGSGSGGLWPGIVVPSGGGPGAAVVPVVVIAPAVTAIIPAVVSPVVAAADHRPRGHGGRRQCGGGHGALPLAKLRRIRALRQGAAVGHEVARGPGRRCSGDAGCRAPAGRARSPRG